MDGKEYNKIASSILLGVLIVLAFLLIKPLLLAIFLGMVLAFVLSPLYKKLLLLIKYKNLSSLIITLLLILLIVIPLWFITPLLLNQSLEIYTASQELDLVTPIKNIFPTFFATETISNEMTNVVYSFISKITNSTVNAFANILLNFPTLALQLIVTLFVFFFTLRDGTKLTGYLQSILPFPKNVEKKLFKSTTEITYSVLYGQVVIGILQGILAGVGFFIFGVNNALFLTLLAAVAGIFPIIGTAIIWVPVAIFTLIGGNVGAFVGIAAFGILSSIMENTVKPAFVAKRTNVNPAIILLGMIGGLMLFGILGIILGPLLLSYLLIVLDVYRDKRIPGALIEPEKN
jgi:predicted PurR-regulated permease PerM